MFQCHVYEDKQANLSGFVTTIAESPTNGGDFGVFALDCEMVRSADTGKVDFTLQCF